MVSWERCPPPFPYIHSQKALAFSLFLSESFDAFSSNLSGFRNPTAVKQAGYC